ncbi:hypothetical protein F2Q69_00017170 [Brassica cretica]|uniref:Uncharacterized protein n=1 Tax=Brassica cretica TaxID=69181 RepID=A0A8S9R8V0_BRACR|nr:hypothetical protein F2Q69_00017170 [Brassica cretica]
MEINTRVEEAYHIMNVQTKQMIMAVGERNRIPHGFQGDEEVGMVYLHFDVASRPSLSCDGLVCIPYLAGSTFLTLPRESFLDSLPGHIQ